MCGLEHHEITNPHQQVPWSAELGDYLTVLFVSHEAPQGDSHEMDTRDVCHGQRLHKRFELFAARNRNLELRVVLADIAVTWYAHPSSRRQQHQTGSSVDLNPRM